MARKSLMKVGLKLGYKRTKGRRAHAKGRVVSTAKLQCLFDRQARSPVGEEWGNKAAQVKMKP